MGAVCRALWYIESHFAENPSLADIARVVGLSPFHLSRVFQLSTGTSVVRYLRGRRLTEAARQLAAGAGDILDVAIVAGYASHAAFTRAFAEQFGRPPEQVRVQGLADLALVEALKLVDTSTPCAIEPHRAYRSGLRVAGIGARHTPATVASIPSQWQRLDEAHGLGAGIAYGVCCNSDADGGFDYIAGVQLGASAPVPPGWQAVAIPPREYLVAWHAGHISAIRSTWFWLLNDYLPASGLTLADAPDLERYDARFDDRSGHGGVEIWLPLTDVLHPKELDPCE
ncbi:helix-turn-helix domain-containing protein [Xanthomonas arboricola pv. juglandis]|uniref:HTH araC/xylS-type domain-containing protein n=3 Tax=Xanthomonas arboricola TaxID=56448 RepID=A0A2S7CL21_9XANT|nr:AraC family transcriptional regulator [Xanthomonas arboricola]AKU49648.1 AraC family transcriptional regulator [Xanthomonas arboricola pv. juglandis]KOB01829.1 AraC family transcriptional regulator [Xanthomonas arboricola]KOB05387.1 AraC family transcriptional regulator [Xanthomonas arboricola]KOB13849.1 AraC family transcriptional regulator [Xanthomonas arboricola]KOB21507.1 AraC family transcriptional regulator [Xanthomonas arboricola]